MPTMTNPETGETKEISMEEFLAAMQGGKISVRQEVRHADGSVTSSLIYGNDVGDGVDRSLNIFGTMNDVLYYAVWKARKIKEADENAEKLFFMDNSGADYEVTIDDTQAPMMHIITCTKDKVRVQRHIRDERKSVGKPISEAEFSFVNGKISATLEDVQKGDKLLLFACGVYEIRKLLNERGQLQKLKELENRSSGVMITKDGEDIEDESGIKTKIVRGQNRPDLPCMMFGGLFAQDLEDAIMMRPYMDELMGDTLYAGMSFEDKVKAAEEGDPNLMEELAQAYLDGDGVEPDFKKATYWFEKLAETGSSSAMFNMGLHYAKGCGVERDFDKAALWMKKAAEAGDDEAPEIAERYASMKELTKKAEAGDAVAQAELAKSYMQMAGSLYQAGPGKDYDEAYKWAKKSADQGNLDGLYALGLCYGHGRGVARDDRASVNTYWKAAEKGHAPSQWNLAVCYLNGQGCERNVCKGYEWAYKAYDQGYQLAIDGLESEGKTIPQIIEKYTNDQDVDVTVEGTQYEGRADRCENLRVGSAIKVVRVKSNDYDENAIEFFYNGDSIGMMPRWYSEDLAPFLDMNRISVSAVVKSCIPKSQRGKRARNADVHLKLIVSENKPETAEEHAKRVAEEEARLKAEEARRIKEAEEKKRLEEERKEAERIRKEKEAAAKAEAERLAKQKAKEAEELAAKMRGRYLSASGMIASSMYHVVALKEDGTVIAAGKNDNGQCNVSSWRNVVAVACDTNGTVGLTSQGTVLYTGSTYHRQNQCTGWRNIKEIAITNECIFGLRYDGTVVATTEGSNGASFSTKPDVTSWRNIVAIRAGSGNVLGIKSDGKIVAIQRNYYGRCEEDYYMDGKSNAQDAAFGYLACGVILHKDGKCTSAGTHYSYVMSPTEINKHNGIVKIDMFGSRPVAILADGSVVIEPSKKGNRDELADFLKKHNIKKVAAVSCGNQFTVLTEDGRIFVKCDSSFSSIQNEECFGKNFRLFENFHKMMDSREAEAERIRKEKEEQERKRREEEKLKAERRGKGVCQHCGGTFKKVLFGMKCVSCGMKKDYK